MTEQKGAKVMHLVLYNPDAKYKAMYYHTRNWYKQFENDIETWYYSYSNSVSQPTFDKENMTILLPGQESYIPGILKKTMAALRIATQRGFTLLIRSNISTVLNFHHLLACVQEQTSKVHFYGGPHIMMSEKVHGHSFVFVQGTCMVFSPRTVNVLLKYESDLNLEIEDDRAIGLLLEKHNIRPCSVGNQYVNFDFFRNIDNVSAFRNHTFESDRKDNIANVRLQVNALFQRYVFLKTPQPVKQVLYYNIDVTSKIIEMCKHVTEWRTSQDNVDLDKLFGDPSPNLRKNLMVMFSDTTAEPLTQRCNLSFCVKDDILLVK